MIDASRKMVAVHPTDEGIQVRFEDHFSGVIPFAQLPEIGSRGRFATLVLPNPYEIHVWATDGQSVEVPWDFARYFCDPGVTPFSWTDRSSLIGPENTSSRTRPD